jgi:hypothetical protein
MANTISKLRKTKLKAELLKGTDAKNALINSGYKKTTARNSTSNKCVQVCQDEIIDDIKSKITVESVLKQLNDARELSIKDKQYSSAIRATELLGKFLAMFTDKSVNETTVESKELLSDIYSGRIGRG